jgi:hypothetical protein
VSGRGELNTELLRLIRAGDPFLRRSISRRPPKPSLIGWFRGVLRVFGGLSSVPLDAPRSVRLYVPGSRRVNSKAGDVYKDLEECGLQSHRICGIPEISRLGELIGFLVRIPWGFVVAVKIHRRTKTLDWINIRLILEYLAYVRLLQKRPLLCPVIISDTTPSMYAMWAAAEHVGARVVWWQDDYHHRGPLKFAASAGAVLNRGGYNALANRCSKTVAFARPGKNLKGLRMVPERPRVGVATNALYSAAEHEIELLDRIRCSLQVDELVIRLHPRVSGANLVESREWLIIAPEAESLEAFSQRIDLVFVGNSASQLKFLCEGVPVVHVAGLDELGFDFYGYCQQRICFGLRSLDELQVHMINHFYNQSKDQSLLSGIIEMPPEEKIKPLSEMGSWLMSRERMSNGSS